MNKDADNINLESNVWKYYFIEALSGFLLIMPIIVPFYQENGLNVTQLFLIQAAFIGGAFSIIAVIIGLYLSK